MHSSYDVLNEAAREAIKGGWVTVPSSTYPSMTALRVSLVRAATAILLNAVDVSVAALAQVIEQLPWHANQRLIFAVNVDLQHDVSAEAAAEPPPPEPASDTDEEVPITSSTASGSADIAPELSVSLSTATGSTAVSVPRVSSPAAPPSGELRLRGSVGLPLRVAVDSVSAELKAAYISLSRSFVLGPTPTTPVPADLTYREGGTFLWNETQGLPASASCRYTGTGPVMILSGGDMEGLRRWERGGNAICLALPQQAARMASDAFLHFWRARPHLRTRIAEWTSEVPPFARAPSGSWLRGRMSELPGSRPNVDDRVGWHGTAFHHLERAAARGLEDGWSGVIVNGVLRLGVYYHVEARAHLCFNYILYSALEQDSGFMFAAFVQLRAPASDPKGRMQHIRRKANTHQELTYQDVCVATDVWIHVRHAVEFLDAPAADRVTVEGHFEQSLETDAMLPRQTLVARAQALSRTR